VEHAFGPALAVQHARPRERLLGQHGVEGHVDAVEGGDAIEVRLHELLAGELAVSDRRGRLRQRQLGEVVEFRHRCGDGGARARRDGAACGDRRGRGQECAPVDLGVERSVGHRAVQAVKGDG